MWINAMVRSDDGIYVVEFAPDGSRVNYRSGKEVKRNFFAVNSVGIYGHQQWLEICSRKIVDCVLPPVERQ